MTKAQKDLIASLPWDEIEVASKETKLDKIIMAACILKESMGSKWAVRFEPGWKYEKDVAVHAKRLGISAATEKNCQMMSWGYMQMMGTVARELGFKGHCTELLLTENNLYYGSKKFVSFLTKWKDLPTAAAAYNAGTPTKLKNGKFKNQAYVDAFMAHYENVKEYLG